MNDRPTLGVKAGLRKTAAAALAARQDDGSGMRRMLGMDGHLTEAEHFRPLKSVKLKIKEPRIREIFWCTFTGSIFPEFGKRRPIVVLSKRNPLGTHSLVAPLTTAHENQDYPYAVKLKENPNPDNPETSYVVADHVYAMSHYRFERFRHQDGTLWTPRMSKLEFARVLEIVWDTLPERRVGGALPEGAENGDVLTSELDSELHEL